MLVSLMPLSTAFFKAGSTLCYRQLVSVNGAVMKAAHSGGFAGSIMTDSLVLSSVTTTCYSLVNHSVPALGAC